MKVIRGNLVLPLSAFLILMQADQMLFCTFTALHHNGPYWSYTAPIKWENLSSAGACLKMCVEEIPECVQAGGKKGAGEEYTCYFFKASEKADYVYDSPGHEYYGLERGVINDSCPIAESLFPA
ncbi:hypothetical protein V3C99_011445 [Haemonchus contortus]|uniref:Apple domain-containing protein n=1 Tax=Haemonchus contortus TaxID=6289 RepID=A0A7I4Y4Q9_HAECO